MEQQNQIISEENSSPCSNESIPNLDPLLQSFINQNNNSTSIIDEKKTKKLNLLKKFSGIIYLLISSLLFTISNFLIKKLNIITLDVIFIRSIIQLLISFCFFLYKNYHPFSFQYFNFLMLIYSLFAANGTICYYLALQYIPLTDLNTIRYTQIIWTILLAFIIYHERITLLIIFSCILTLIGIICVIQPTFIFSKTLNFNETLDISLLKNNHNNKYLFGIFISLLCAFSISISIILNKKLFKKKIHQSIIIFYFILTSFLMLLIKKIYDWISLEINYDIFNIKKIYLKKNFLYAIILATLQLIPMILTQKSIKYEHPSIISIIQACEIIFTIILEILFSTTKLNFLTLIGSTFVLTSIVIVGIQKFCQDQSNKQTNILILKK